MEWYGMVWDEIWMGERGRMLLLLLTDARRVDSDKDNDDGDGYVGAHHHGHVGDVGMEAGIWHNPADKMSLHHLHSEVAF